MDDNLDSVPDDDQGVMLYRHLSELWAGAGMLARKWLSNLAKVLEEIPIQDRASEVEIDKYLLPTVKTLGVTWLQEEDVFTFKANPPESGFEFTKRNFLKKIAILFDPIGFLAPFTIRAQTMLQEMWVAGLDWDNPLPGELINRQWFCELEDLPAIKVPRCLRLGQEEVVKSETLHTFVDVSQDAYGAAVFSRIVYKSGLISRRLVVTKTRVAPLATTSIPRLELMAAVLDLRLTESVSRVLNSSLSEAVFWSDSMNVLWWIRGRSRKFKPFVANRIREIQSFTNPKQWRYVPTNENPADFLTRGMTVSGMAEKVTWWNGPDFLEKEESDWLVNHVDTDVVLEEAEMKKTDQKCSTRSNQQKGNWTLMAVFDEEQSWRISPKRFSSWKRLVRVHAWILRFISNCRCKGQKEESGELSSDEIEDATSSVIRSTQRKAFPDEYSHYIEGYSYQRTASYLDYIRNWTKKNKLDVTAALNMLSFFHTMHVILSLS